MLSRAGITDTDSDGWLDRDGQRLEFAIRLNGNNDLHQKLGWLVSLGGDRSTQRRLSDATSGTTVSAGTSVAFAGTGGTSSENGGCGFRPAFLDSQTGVVYACCHEDGRRTRFRTRGYPTGRDGPNAFSVSICWQKR